MRPWRCLSLGLDAVSLGLLFREKISRRRRIRRCSRLNMRVFALGFLDRIEMLLLKLRYFARVMAFAGIEKDDQAGESNERKER